MALVVPPEQSEAEDNGDPAGDVIWARKNIRTDDDMGIGT